MTIPEVVKQEKYTLTITTDAAVSTDERFTMDNLLLGDNYKPLDTYYRKFNGEEIRRNHNKGEKTITNQTMPRIAFQIFENQIAALSNEEKESFPTCQYTANGEIYRGVFSSVADFKNHRNTIEYITYTNSYSRKFVIYGWNIFSTIMFVQECLKRFGKVGDQFVLIYRDKPKKDSKPDNTPAEVDKYLNKYSEMLLDSKNIILRGAPGTGKTYLAKRIAADIVSEQYTEDYGELTKEQREQIEFVQFHPSYDYSDFVEGLRPKINKDGSMGFELRDGIFKEFVDRARKNYKNYEESSEKLKKYIFIIDEINRGEISKIFGELFFAIDPGYRGDDGTVATQYANMHSDPDKKFYIPDNVYIIGTMNDIDRSVDSFDFAMRRRFRFIELKADEHTDMLSDLDETRRKDAINRMARLNSEIVKVEDLNANYQIGGAYFMKLKELSSDDLWTDFLQPLLQEYIQGTNDEEGTLKKLAEAYGYQKPDESISNEDIED